MSSEENLKKKIEKLEKVMSSEGKFDKNIMKNLPRIPPGKIITEYTLVHFLPVFFSRWRGSEGNFQDFMNQVSTPGLRSKLYRKVKKHVDYVPVLGQVFQTRV